MTSPWSPSPTIDNRHQQVDFALTAGQAWTTTVCAVDEDGLPIDLSAATIEASIIDSTGAEVLAMTLDPTNYAVGCIGLHLNGTETSTAPLGIGAWFWSLTVDGVLWVGGRWQAYSSTVFRPRSVGCNPDNVTVCVGSEVRVTVSSCGGGGGNFAPPPGYVHHAITENGVAPFATMSLPFSPWGVTALGQPYYDINGVAAEDRAWLQFNPLTGNPVLTRIGG